MVFTIEVASQLCNSSRQLIACILYIYLNAKHDATRFGALCRKSMRNVWPFGLARSAHHSETSQSQKNNVGVLL